MTENLHTHATGGCIVKIIRQEDNILNHQKAIDIVALDFHMTHGQRLGFRSFLNNFIYQGNDELVHDFIIQKAIEFSRTLEFHMDLLAAKKQNQGRIA